MGSAVQAAAARAPGTRSAVYEGLGGETRVRFELDRDALARHGVDPATARAVADLLLAGGDMGELALPAGAPASAARPLRVRLSLSAPWLVKQPQDLVRDATVRAGRNADGQPVPLALLGRAAWATVPAMMRAERGELSGYVYVDLDDGTDIEGYVARARRESRPPWVRCCTRRPASAWSGPGNTSCSPPGSAACRSSCRWWRW